MDERLAGYLAELREALVALEADPAVVQDAEFDAAEHFESAMAEGGSFAQASADYGSPQEVASAYLNAEDSVTQALRAPRRAAGRLLEAPDPGTWSSIAYMLLSLGTGIAYFALAAVGISLSLSLAVFIIGVPVFLVFIGLVRTASLVEGRPSSASACRVAP